MIRFYLDDTVGGVADLVDDLDGGRVAHGDVVLRQRHHHRRLALVVVFTCELLLVDEVDYG